MVLSASLIATPPLTLRPIVERHGRLPPDIEEFVATLVWTVGLVTALGGVFGGIGGWLRLMMVGGAG